MYYHSIFLDKISFKPDMLKLWIISNAVNWFTHILSKTPQLKVSNLLCKIKNGISGTPKTFLIRKTKGI